MEKISNRINVRSFIVSNLEKYIEESVYYRNFSFEIKEENKIVIFNYKDESGKGAIS